MTKYLITFKDRGDITDAQKAKLLKKLRLQIVKEKKKGSEIVWTVKGPGGLNDAKLADVRKKCKITKEMGKATIEEK